MATDPLLLNLVVAHGLEAKPLIEWFDLKPVSAASNLFESERGIRLIVTGMGRKNMSFTLNQLKTGAGGKSSTAAWLNLGIAGHQRLPVGETLLANKIICAANDLSVYPSPILTGSLSGTVTTVDEPELNYPDDSAYDMEAYAFWEAASAMGALDLVQSFKVISDNPDSGTEKVTAALIAELLSSAAAEIRQLVEQLLSLAAEQQVMEAETPEFIRVRESMHLSVNQLLQARRLCQRYRALKLGDELLGILNQRHQDARALITSLKEGLRAADWRAGTSAYRSDCWREQR